jgi:CubicO group peptidase (beta-lactamase class C family)
MLIEDGKIKLSDPIAQYLPAFDVEGKREITIQHLITHTSGLPMSAIMNMDLSTLDSIQSVAELGGSAELEFQPGTAFTYSDQGTDTLTALIEVASGMAAADFVQTRILDPLGMTESATMMTKDHPLRARGCSKYMGMPGYWNPFWNTQQDSLFPFFLGSQGLYSTLSDYARFTNLWLNNGRVGDQQLLNPALMAQALTPSPYPLNSPTGLPGLRTDYGSLMQLWTAPATSDENSARKVIAFGHTGSDGTHAWVFPEQNAMAFYFTQSRATLTGYKVEAALGELFLGVPVPEQLEAAPPLEQYLGYYWENSDDNYMAIVRKGEGLAVEVPGKALVPMDYVGDDSWRVELSGEVLVFERDENGAVIGFQNGDDHQVRFTPSPDLPSVAELEALHQAAHHLELLESVGPLRLNSTIDFVTLGMKGEISSLYAWPDRYRMDALVGTEFEHMAVHGSEVSYHSRLKPAAVSEGIQADQIRIGHHLARLGQWSRWFPHMEVIQQLERGGKTLLLVRAGDTSASVPTLFVDANTGLVLGEDNVVFMEGMGMLGQRLRFGDYREVSGMQLPFTIKTKFANRMIGTVISTVQNYELGEKLEDRTFELQPE